MKAVNTSEEIGLLSSMIHYGHTSSLQDYSWHVSLSPSLWQIIPSPFGMKRCLDLNEMEELRNDAYINSKIAKQRMKRWHDHLISNKEFQRDKESYSMTLGSTSFRKAKIKVDRPFHCSPSAFQWSSGTTQFQQHKHFQSQWPPSQAIHGAFQSR
ncbi:hypothetical protein AAG906_027297 [Vitis piasezkii]